VKVPQNGLSPALPEYRPEEGPRGLSIRDKLLVFTLALLSIAILGLSSAAFFLSSGALRRARLDGFRSLRGSFSEVISRFFADHRRGIATQAESQTFRYAASELSAGYQELIDDLEDAGLSVDDALIASLRDRLRIAYEKYFATMSALDISKRAVAQIGDLSREGVIVQFVYIVGRSGGFGAPGENESGGENSDALASRIRTAFSKTTYARAVERYQPSIEAVVGRNRYNDLLFIDNRGNVVYSFGKSWDLGTNVVSGWLANTNLKKVFVGAWYGPPGASSADADHVMVTDLEDYPAKNNRPVMFLGAAISDRLGEQQGVLVHEIDSRQITSIITFDEHWTQVGLGRSGEAYIVGPDRRLRTESRFLQELPAALTIPSATEAAEPLDDPPGVCSMFHGFRVPRGCVAANSVVTVLPMITAPASRSARTHAASFCERQPANKGEPISVGMSTVSIMSLMPTGMPSIGDAGLPARQRSVDRSAAARASGTLVHTKAPIRGSH